MAIHSGAIVSGMVGDTKPAFLITGANYDKVL